MKSHLKVNSSCHVYIAQIFASLGTQQTQVCIVCRAHLAVSSWVIVMRSNSAFDWDHRCWTGCIFTGRIKVYAVFFPTPFPVLYEVFKYPLMVFSLKNSTRWAELRVLISGYILNGHKSMSYQKTVSLSWQSGKSQGFSASALLTFGAGRSLRCDCPVSLYSIWYRRLLNRIPGSPPTGWQQRFPTLLCYSQKCLHFAKCPLEGRITSSWEPLIHILELWDVFSSS